MFKSPFDLEISLIWWILVMSNLKFNIFLDDKNEEIEVGQAQESGPQWKCCSLLWPKTKWRVQPS